MMSMITFGMMEKWGTTNYNNFRASTISVNNDFEQKRKRSYQIHIQHNSATTWNSKCQFETDFRRMRNFVENSDVKSHN